MTTEERQDVFVVDDHAVVRVGVRSFLEGTGRFRVVAEASSLTEARMRMSTLPESTTFLERRGFFPNSSYVQMRLDHISSQPEPRVPEGVPRRPEQGRIGAEFVARAVRHRAAPQR